MPARAGRPQPDSGLFLGVDAGNSKTVALLGTASGEIVGAGRAGCGDIYGTETEEIAVDAVFAAIDAALAQATAARSQVRGTAFLLAGVDWPEDLEFWQDTLGRRWPDLANFTIHNDGFAAMRCGDLSGIGVVVAAGTGAAVAARNANDERWDIGGRAHHEMGAIGLVAEAVRAVALANYGASQPTALTPALLSHFGVPTPVEISHLLSRRKPITQAERVTAARLVLATAVGGDEVAAGIVDEQARRLAIYAEIAARKVGLRGTPFPIVLSGSVLMATDSPLATALHAHLAELVPEGIPHIATLPPVAGTLLDALAVGSIPLDLAIRDRVAATMPDQAFLET
ncbi:MAG TPA: BadF/BadG/BcrA/BcrD ATPase family protein [Pseudolysinimonas sp.]